MLAAVILGGGELLVTEAAVSAILVSTLSATPQVRLVEVLIGGGVALAVHTLVFPPEPVSRGLPGDHIVFSELGAILRDAAAALGAGDPRPAEAAVHGAESVESELSDLAHAVATASDTVRWAPLRRGSRTALGRYARTVPHADLAARNVRVLARNVRRYVRAGNPPHPEFAGAIRDLGLAAWELPAQFDEPWRNGDVLRLAFTPPVGRPSP